MSSPTAAIEFLQSPGEKSLFLLDESKLSDFLIYSIVDRDRVNATILNANAHMSKYVKIIGESDNLDEMFSRSGRSWFDEPVACIDHHQFTEPARGTPVNFGVKKQTLKWLMRNPDEFVCIIPKRNNGEYIFGFTRAVARSTTPPPKSKTRSAKGGKKTRKQKK